MLILPFVSTQPMMVFYQFRKMRPIIVVITLLTTLLHYVMFRPEYFLLVFKLHFFVILIGGSFIHKGFTLFFSENVTSTSHPQQASLQKQIGITRIAIGILGLMCLFLGSSFEFLLAITVLITTINLGCGLIRIQEMIVTRKFFNGPGWTNFVLETIVVPVVAIILVNDHHNHRIRANPSHNGALSSNWNM